MQKEYISKVLQFRGSHYEFGLFQGEKIRNSPLLSRRERQWRLYKPKFKIDVKEARLAYKDYAPGLWEELEGLSDSLEMPMEQVLRDFGGYRVPGPKSGCSTVVSKDYIVRNYDYLPSTYDGRYVLFQPTDKGYATIGPSQRIVGRMDGMNEHGLSIAYNFTHRKDPGLGFICHAIGRIVLEQAKDTEEAVELLKELPHRHSFTYLVLDQKGEKRTVEATPRKIKVHSASLCTNHFHVQKKENRNFIQESLKRLQALEENWREYYSVSESFSLLNDPTKGIFVEEYKNWAGTIHTSAYVPKKLEAHITLGTGPSRTIIPFKDWLLGHDVKVQEIIGQIKTDIPFAYTE